MADQPTPGGAMPHINKAFTHANSEKQAMPGTSQPLNKAVSHLAQARQFYAQHMNDQPK